jgi:hypothetical protein
MRVLLRHKKTGLYYVGLNQMAGEHNQARDFTSVPQAARFAFAEAMPEVEIIVRCDYLAHEVSLQPLPEWCELDQARPLAAARTVAEGAGPSAARQAA